MQVRGAAQDILELRRGLASEGHSEGVLSRVAAYLGQAFQADLVQIFIKNLFPSESKNGSSRASKLKQVVWSANEKKRHLEVELFSLTDDLLRFRGESVALPFCVSDLSRSFEQPALLRVLSLQSVKSFALVGIWIDETLIGWIELRFSSRYQRLRREDVFYLQRVAEYCGFYLEKLRARDNAKVKVPASLPPSAASEVSSLTSSVLIEHANLVILRTNAHGEISDVRGDTQRILGLTHEELKGNREIWSRFVHNEDLRELAHNTRHVDSAPKGITQEVRVINRLTAEVKWFLVKAVPILDQAQNFKGWEGVGFDITEKRRTEQELSYQGKRIQALYEVSRALQGNMDPAVVALKGLRALIEATGADCGFAAFYDRAANSLELVASHGLSASYLQKAPGVLNGASLLRHVIETREGVMLDNIQRDSRASIELAKAEGLRSTILMPLICEGEVLGAIALFCRRAYRYRNADFELVEAACRQIALSARQAELYASEKRQANSLAALYKLSHEMSRFLTPREIVEHAFPIIQSEFACKRMWLGVLNDQATHVIGQGGMGPGVRGRLLSIQIELGLRHDFFDQAIRAKQPVVVKAGSQMECSGLNRVVKRLRLGTFIIVPLVSLGQVVGVLVVEPAMPSAFFAQRKLPLLTSMANEIATVVLARRFEAKMADAAKMRMATLLASGVAHNFNNLLQAVMGQASLIEMQSPPDSPLASAGRTIIEAAGKGAALIKQLLSFTLQSSNDRRALSVKELLADTRDFYQSALGSAIRLEFEFEGESPKVRVDYNQIQQVITNLLVNAKEAIGVKDRGMVKISTHRVRLRSGEVDPELAPGAYLRIDIADNGIGMDAEKQARCFEPFFTTKNVDLGTGLGFQGSGLGLSSAYSVVKSHEGIITVQSQVDVGTTFSIYLPAFGEEQHRLLGAERTQTDLAPRALIVELDRPEALVIDSVLETLGVKSATFQDSQGAIELLKKNEKHVRLIFIDLDRSSFNVTSFVRLLRSENKDLHIVALCRDQTRWQSILSGVENLDLLQKPLSARSLRPVIERPAQDALVALADQIEIEKYASSKEPLTKIEVGEKKTWPKKNSDTN